MSRYWEGLQYTPYLHPICRLQQLHSQPTAFQIAAWCRINQLAVALHRHSSLYTFYTSSYTPSLSLVSKRNHYLLCWRQIYISISFFVSSPPPLDSLFPLSFLSLITHLPTYFLLLSSPLSFCFRVYILVSFSSSHTCSHSCSFHLFFYSTFQFVK